MGLTTGQWSLTGDHGAALVTLQSRIIDIEAKYDCVWEGEALD